MTHAADLARDSLPLVTEPLLLHPPAIASIANLLADPGKFIGEQPPKLDSSPLVKSLATASNATTSTSGSYPQSPTILSNGMAIIQAQGFLMREANMLTRWGLATSTVMLADDLQALQRNSRVRSIVMLCNSPGGLALGNEECASEIAAERGNKPMTAIVNGLCASAMYYIAAALDSIVASPSSLVGSIGTVTAHIDYSEYLAKAGLKVELIQFGQRKSDGSPYVPLEKAAREAIQERIDSYGWQFVASVARHRGITPAEVRQRYGDGKVYLGPIAVKQGLADRVGTFKQFAAGQSNGREQNALDSAPPRLRFSLGSGTRSKLYLANVIPSAAKDSPEQSARAVEQWYQRHGKPLPRNADQLERDAKLARY